MPPEEKHKINVWIPESLWKQIETLGYDSPTKATIAAFEALVLKGASGSNQGALGSFQEVFGSIQEAVGNNQEALGSTQEALGSTQEIEGYKRDIIGYKENIKVLNIEITRLKEALAIAPDPSELVDLRARFEERQKLLDEKDKRIEELNEHKDIMSRFANYFSSGEPKLIEAPAAERKKPWWRFW
jgi:chromosome segregation ATPase